MYLDVNACVRVCVCVCSVGGDRDSGFRTNV